jgi:hypothetical protein
LKKWAYKEYGCSMGEKKGRYNGMDLHDEGQEEEKGDATKRILRPVQALSCLMLRPRIARIYKHAEWTAQKLK